MRTFMLAGVVLALGAVLVLATTACGGGGGSTTSDRGPAGPAAWDGATWDSATWEP